MLGSRDEEDDAVGKVMHGTGQYAKVTGRGMRSDVWRESGLGPWYARRVGLLTFR